MKEIFHWNDRELLRYLGCKNGTVPDQNLTDLIAQCKQELEQAAEHCYAVEGRYPPDLDYLEEHYGIRTEHRRFAVD